MCSRLICRKVHCSFLCKLGERRVCLVPRMCNGHSVVYIRGSEKSRSCPRYFLLGLKNNVILVLYFQKIKGLAFSSVSLFSFTHMRFASGLPSIFCRLFVIDVNFIYAIFQLFNWLTVGNTCLFTVLRSHRWKERCLAGLFGVFAAGTNGLLVPGVSFMHLKVKK